MLLEDCTSLYEGAKDVIEFVLLMMLLILVYFLFRVTFLMSMLNQLG
jgi:hypothetical protein